MEKMATAELATRELSTAVRMLAAVIVSRRFPTFLLG